MTKNIKKAPKKKSEPIALTQNLDFREFLAKNPNLRPKKSKRK